MTTAIYIQDKNSTLSTNKQQLYDSLNVGDMFIDDVGNYYLVCNSPYGDDINEDLEYSSGFYLFSLKDFMIYDAAEILTMRTHRIYFPVQIVDADISVNIKY